MFLFIFESIGTQELILIGIVALVFLGPRKLPEMARKAGKIMSEFRGTASEFKETWQREVDFEEEKKAFRIDDLDEPVMRVNSIPAAPPTETIASPEIKQIDPARFENLKPDDPAVSEPDKPILEISEKKNWL